MTIGLRAVGAQAGGGSVSSVSPPIPTGTRPRDTMVLLVGGRTVTRTVSGLTSWTPGPRTNQGTTTGAWVAMYVKTAGASEVAPTITLSAADVTVAFIASYDGTDYPNLLDVAVASLPAGTTGTTGTALSSPALTTLTPYATVLRAYCTGSVGTTVPTVSGAGVEFSGGYAGAASSFVVALQDARQATPGSSGAGSATSSSSSASWVGETLALRAASGDVGRI